MALDLPHLPPPAAPDARPSPAADQGPRSGLAALRGLQLRPRAVELQVVLFWRVRPAALRALVPAGLEPLVLRGHALLSVAYTRAAGRSGRWVARRLGAPVDTLAYRIPVEPSAGSPRGEGNCPSRRTTWVPRRATTSWIEARFGERLLGGSFARAEFQVRHADGVLRLRVDVAGREELELHASAALAPPAQALLRDPREVEDLLRSTACAWPRDPLAPEADAPLGPRSARALEPLTVHELRTPWLDALGFAPGDASFDSAYRATGLRRLPLALPPRRAPLDAPDLGLSTT